MTRLAWGALEQRFYEAGLDRGVLYVGGTGVAWSGLVSVTESPSGGEAKPFYFDGIKYVNVASAEEFEATIIAVSSPPEFAACDGISAIHNGLFATQQPRKQFSMSYRTLVGNGNGSDFGYKIHLVYNALAAPSQRGNKTLGDSAEPMGLSWQITTLPPEITGYKRTAHLVVDTRYTSPTVLATLEDTLYGTELAAPSLPTPDELIAMFA